MPTLNETVCALYPGKTYNEALYSWAMDNGAAGGTLDEVLQQAGLPAALAGFSGTWNERMYEFFAAGGTLGYSHKPVTFNGSTLLVREAGLTGIVDGSFLTIAFKAKFSTAGGTVFALRDSYTLAMISVAHSSGTLILSCNDVAADAFAGRGFDGKVVSAGIPQNVDVTVHIAIRNDSGNQTLRVWVDGAELTVSAPTWTNAGSIAFASGADRTTIGANHAVANPINGTLSMLYATVGTTTDHYITDPAKFYDGGDVSLGPDGTRTGLPAPVLFFGGQQSVASWNAGTNQGTGGNYTVTGAVT